MKNPVIISFIIILHILSLSCRIQNKGIIKDDSIEINLKESDKQIYLSQYLTHDQYIALETTPSCLIGHIKKIEIYNDFIFILDSYVAKKLLVFDKKGKFIQQISEYGKGPGEYLDIFDFVIRNNKIYILNNRTSVNEYAIDGTFIKTYLLPFWAERLLPINKNHWGLITNSDKSYGYDFNFYLTSFNFNNEKGSLKSKFDDFPIAPFQQVSLLNNTPYFFLPLDNKIYSTDAEGVYKKYRLQFPKDCIISDSELQKYSKLSVRNRTEEILKSTISLSSIIFSDNLKIIQYYQQNKLYFCFFNSEKEHIAISEEKVINDIDSVPFLPLFYSNIDNKIISIFQQYKLIDAIHNSKKINKDLIKIISESDESANPIIAIYSIN